MPTRDELLRIIKEVIGLKQGTYMVIRTNDTIELVNEKPTLDKVYAAIGTSERKCECCDVVNLKIPGGGSHRQRIVMMVDDTGMLDNLPKNQLAFHLAWTIRAYPHDIHGNVVIVNDEDFA